jgi:hypothetical protein
MPYSASFFVVPRRCIVGYVLLYSRTLLATEMICEPLEFEKVGSQKADTFRVNQAWHQIGIPNVFSKIQSPGSRICTEKKSVYVSPSPESYHGIIKGVINQLRI